MLFTSQLVLLPLTFLVLAFLCLLSLLCFILSIMTWPITNRAEEKCKMIDNIRHMSALSFDFCIECSGTLDIILFWNKSGRMLMNVLRIKSSCLPGWNNCSWLNGPYPKPQSNSWNLWHPPSSKFWMTSRLPLFLQPTNSCPKPPAPKLCSFSSLSAHMPDACNDMVLGSQPKCT